MRQPHKLQQVNTDHQAGVSHPYIVAVVEEAADAAHHVLGHVFQGCWRLTPRGLRLPCGCGHCCRSFAAWVGHDRSADDEGIGSHALHTEESHGVGDAVECEASSKKFSQPADLPPHLDDAGHDGHYGGIHHK